MQWFRGFIVAGCLASGLVSAETPVYNMFDCSGPDSDIAVVFRAQPYYPHSALMYCLSGSTRLQFTVDVHGRTQDIEVLDSTPPGVFERASIEAVKRWQFEPACRNGERADREATQVIQFELPPGSANACRNQHEAISEEGLRLLGELGARYALLAEIHLGEIAPDRLQDSVARPLGEFPGDLGKIARFHEKTLNGIARSAHEMPQATVGFSDVLDELSPAGLSEQPDLSRLHAVMDTYRSQLRQAADYVRDQQNRLAAELERVERETEYSREDIDRFVTPFLGDVSGSAEAIHTAYLEPVEHLQALVDLLELRQGSWRIDGDSVVFESPADQTAWDEQFQVMRDRQQEVRQATRNWLRTFRDYSD